MELIAQCTRYGKWWVVDVPEVAGLHTQVKRLDQVEAMTKDAASLLLERPESDFTVTVVPHMDDATLATVSSVTQAREQARHAEEEATRISREAASMLAAEGLTVRDIGTILGVSYQHAAKLAA